MMWDVELAKRINKIDRKTDRGIGHGIGVIVSKSPLKISLADGQVLLDDDDFTITDTFKVKLDKADEIVNGDKVIVLSVDGQSFFIIDKVG